MNFITDYDVQELHLQFSPHYMHCTLEGYEGLRRVCVHNELGLIYYLICIMNVAVYYGSSSL